MATTTINVKYPGRQPWLDYEFDNLLGWELKHFAMCFNADFAQVVMHAKQGNIPMDVAKLILAGLLRLRDAGVDSIEINSDSIVGIIEKGLAKDIGPVPAGFLHIARSRVDLSATQLRLSARPKFLASIEACVSLQGALVNFAEKYAGTAMPYHTHLQHSQPGTAGHFILAYAFRFQDDLKTCMAAYAELNRCPLGTVGRSGTPWNVDRDLTANLLGFDEKVEHSLQGRDVNWAVNIVAAISRIMFDLRDLGADFQLWLGSEYGYAALGEGHSSYSSIFPHKSNPVTTDTVRRYTLGAMTWTATAHSGCTSMGTGDHLIRGVPLLEDWIETTTKAIGIMTKIVPAITMNEKRIKAILDSSWATTTNLVDTLTREEMFGKDYRTPHDVVVHLVNNCKEKGITKKDLTPEMFAAAAKAITGKDFAITAEKLNSALSVESFINECVSAGSVTRTEVDRMIGVAKGRIEKNGIWVKDTKTKLADAANNLMKEVYAIVNTDDNIATE